MQLHQSRGLPAAYRDGVSFRNRSQPSAGGGTPPPRRRFASQALGVWALFLGFAVINGLFRERVLEPHLGPEIAHFLATTTLAGFVFFGTLLFVGLRSDAPAKIELVGVGILWAALTALLELGLGVARGVAGADLFRDYDVSRGRLFGLVILAELLSPPFAGWLRRLRR